MFRDFNKGGYKPLIDATWAITSGVSPDKVALWIGDQVERFYGTTVIQT